MALRYARSYTTESQWPKAPPPKDLPPPESFHETSRPRPYHRRQERDLPPLEVCPTRPRNDVIADVGHIKEEMAYSIGLCDSRGQRMGTVPRVE